MGISASRRLRKQRDFKQVRAGGIRISKAPFIIQCFRGDTKAETVSRLGIIASRRVGNAVKRNRGKRICRELFRAYTTALPLSCDLVIVLRSSFNQYSFDQLKADYLRACVMISEKLKRG